MISEHASATVPSLRLLNRGTLPVLILDGEEVVGGLQNRVVNTSLLIAAETGFDLPVSCIEHGRWRQVRKDFDAGETVHPTLRRRKAEQVTASFATLSAAVANQSEVWAEVDTRHRQTGTRSATAALRDAYTARRSELEAAERDLPYPSDDPTGVVAVVNGQAACADLFDRSDTLRQYWTRLVRSYALEAIGASDVEPRLDSASHLLAAVGGAGLRPFPSPGLGVDLRITGNIVVGSSLIHASNVLHTALFWRQQPLEGGMLSPGERRLRFAPLARRMPRDPA
jgi:hypothetical protein